MKIPFTSLSFNAKLHSTNKLLQQHLILLFDSLSDFRWCLSFIDCVNNIMKCLSVFPTAFQASFAFPFPPLSIYSVNDESLLVSVVSFSILFSYIYTFIIYCFTQNFVIHSGHLLMPSLIPTFVHSVRSSLFYHHQRVQIFYFYVSFLFGKKGNY